MSTLVPLVDRTIAALHAEHTALSESAAGISEDRLASPSAATRWSLAHVLSHLGSGSEIALAGLRAALGQAEPPGDDFNQTVWDRWNALSPVEQRDAYLDAANAFDEAVQALDAEQRENLQVTVSFMPVPLPLVAWLGMRLSEYSLHSWDVRVALHPGAELSEDTAAVLADLLLGPTNFMLNFVGQADKVPEPVALDIVGTGFGVAIGEQVALLRAPDAPTATFAGPLEAAVRLFAGRLRPEYTPAGLRVVGNVTLEQLREVFPGY